MNIRTEPHAEGLSESLEHDLHGHRHHAYKKVVREGRFGLPRLRAFRCPGRQPVPLSHWRTTEQRILDEVRRIRELIEQQ